MSQDSLWHFVYVHMGRRKSASDAVCTPWAGQAEEVIFPPDYGLGGFILEEKKKKIPLSIVIIGVLVVFLAAYYIYVNISTTPEEEAYAAAVQKVVELFDEKSNKAQQEEQKDKEEKTESYVEKIAKEEEQEARPYFDKYRKEYVKKENDSYRVELPVQEIMNSKVIREYTYEISVMEKDGKYIIDSMERKEIE